MNSLTRIMSYDKIKFKNQENCNCDSAENVDLKNQIIEYPKLSEKEIEQIISERYSNKDEKTKTFIKKALRKHGDRYDYSNVIYVKSDKKVEIICRVEGHDPFPQTPNKHIQGRGCRKCQYKKLSDKRMTKEEFIEKARKIHGYKYDYSKVEYINYNKDVIITCNIHGDFPQTPHHHLNGCGCSVCAGNKKLTKEEFIKRAKEIHGNRYDYSKINYINIDTDVIIICSKHGEFPQTPYNHLQGQGCKLCGIKKRADERRMTKEEFIKRAKEIHGNKYDYSLVDYKGCNIEIQIICPIHDSFPQKPNNHLQGQGCPYCAYKYVGECNKLTYEEFIEKARKIHNNKYDYSLVDYKGIDDEVQIICPVHGKFPQKPRHHLCGSGCSKCNSSKGEIAIRIFLIENKIEFEEQKRFADCKYKKQLPFDFYVSKYNLCIEYDGECHFKKINWNGNLTEKQMEDNLKSYQIRDEIKNDYCKFHNINLLRIQYDENVGEKLTEYFQNHKRINNFLN